MTLKTRSGNVYRLRSAATIYWRMLTVEKYSYTVSLQAGYRLTVDHVMLILQVYQVTITLSLSERIEECVIRDPE